MSFDPQFLEMMEEIITIERVKSHDAQGMPDDWYPPDYYRCRISGKGIALRHMLGDESTVIWDAWLDAAWGVISIEDRVTLPDDPRWTVFSEEPPALFAVGRYTDEDGHYHVKLQFGWMYHRQGQ